MSLFDSIVVLNDTRFNYFLAFFIIYVNYKLEIFKTKVPISF